jgi:hypothetical protein
MIKITKAFKNKLLIESFQTDYIGMLDVIATGGFDSVDKLFQ